MKRNNYLFVACVLFLNSTLTGCLANIKIKDSNAFSPALRASYDLRPPEKSRKPLAIDMDVSRVKGISSQTLGSGDYIQHGYALINGPAELSASCDVTNAMFGVRGGWLLKERFGIEMVGGIDILSSDVKVQSSDISASESLNGTGLYFGWKFSFKPDEKTKLYGKGIVSTDFSDYGYGLFLRELAAAVHLNRNLALFAGWHWLSLNYARQIDSNIQMDVSGPMAGLELAF